MAKKRRTEKKSLELTDDLITDIISRVPEKDLMRFTCVSQSWCSLINTDPYLSQLRSHRTALLGRPFLIIQTRPYFPRDDLTFYYNYWLELDSIEDGNPKRKELYNPFDDDHDRPREDACVKCSCNGLVVLQQHSTRKIVVLNLATKKYHVVPPNPAGDANVVFSGFGFDHVHGCYKLVTKIEHASGNVLDHVELMIHNVNNGTWKKSRFEGLDDDCSSQLCYPKESVDGALYWCVVDSYYDFKKDFMLCSCGGGVSRRGSSSF